MKKKNKKMKPWVKNILVGILIVLVAFSTVGALFVMETSAVDESAPQVAGASDISAYSACSHYSLRFEPLGNGTHNSYCSDCGILQGVDVPCTYALDGTCEFCDSTASSAPLDAYLNAFCFNNKWSNVLGGSVSPVYNDDEGFLYVRSEGEIKRSALSSSSVRITIGKYLFIKYRMVSDEPSYLKLLLLTTESSSLISAVTYGSTDNEWKVVCIDLTSILPDYVGVEMTVRFEAQHDCTLDLAYIAFDDDLSLLCGLLSDNEPYWTSNNGLLSANRPSVPHGSSTSCEHSYDDNGNCTICGFACPHKLVDRIYSNASATHHNEYCGTCGFGVGLVKHSATANGKCVCGYVVSCDHSFDYFRDDDSIGHYGICSRCGYTSSLSACSISSSGVCTLCGYLCPSHKLNSSGYCYGCYYQCPHTDTLIDSLGAEGHAIFCNTCQNLLPDSSHTYVDGKCSVCGYECKHILVDGGCAICGFICSHPNGSIISFDDSGHVFRCSVCQEADLRYPHNFGLFGPNANKVLCIDCGYECKHIIVDGSCSICGYLCMHLNTTVSSSSSTGHTLLCSDCGSAVVNGHIFNGLTTPCDICGYRCSHAWTDGTCTLCNYPCPHVYVGGRCSVCSSTCLSHEYNDRGICSICGGIKQTVTDGFEVGFVNLFSAIYDAQANTFFSLLGYNIMGINIANLIIAIVGLGIIAFVLKKVI